MTVSVLLLTLNEEINLPGCFKSLSWCDDIVVLDSYSSDSTLVLAKQKGARIFQRKFDSFAGQRNYALENISFKNDWILHLDADEILTFSLYKEMLKEINKNCFDAFRIPSKTIFLGKWLRYAGMYPVYQVRLGHRNRLRFKQAGHGQTEDLSPERIGTLREPYLHNTFSKGLNDWFNRHNYYSTKEAQETLLAQAKKKKYNIDWLGLFSLVSTRRHRALKILSYRLPFRPLLRFFYMYIWCRGFLDGYAGLIYCRLLSIYEYMIVVKTHELLKNPITKKIKTIQDKR
jgi:glycosyltransferase involved in cell wall biosynthesis